MCLQMLTLTPAIKSKHTNYVAELSLTFKSMCHVMFPCPSMQFSHFQQQKNKTKGISYTFTTLLWVHVSWRKWNEIVRGKIKCMVSLACEMVSLQIPIFRKTFSEHTQKKNTSIYNSLQTESNFSDKSNQNVSLQNLWNNLVIMTTAQHVIKSSRCAPTILHNSVWL